MQQLYYIGKARVEHIVDHAIRVTVKTNRKRLSFFGQAATTDQRYLVKET